MRLKLDSPSKKLKKLKARTEKWRRAFAFLWHRTDDDTNTSRLYKAFASDAPTGIAIPFAGRIQGWKNARVDVTVVASTDTTVLLGYVKVAEGIPYAEWDSYR